MGVRPVPASPAQVLAALVRSGVVDAAVACDGRVMLHDASRSNPVFVISLDGEPRYAVKQRVDVEAGSPADAETAAYRWLAAEPRLVGVAARVALLPEETAGRWLVLDVDPRACPLHDMIVSMDGDLRLVVRELGRLLRRLHSVSARAPGARSAVPVQRPWVLELPSGARPDFAAENPAAGSAVADLQADAELMELVSDVGEAWRASAVIHGDVKWDNVLVRPQRGSWRLSLIDWELAGWGDPLWDLAGVVEGLLTTSVLTRGTAGVKAATLLTRAAVAAYGLPPAAVDALVRLVAVRLLQVTVQLAGMMGGDESASMRGPLLELASSLAKDPAAWAHELCHEEAAA